MATPFDAPGAPPSAPPGAPPPAPPGMTGSTGAAEHVATFDRYADAQAAVDRLSDGGFPVESVSIVWTDLRRVEQVTGRRTIARAFLEGALTGAWFGLLIGLLLVLLFDEGGTGELWIVLWYVLVGALAAGALSALLHWSQRGRRDFASVGYLDAARYEVWVGGGFATRARDELGGGTAGPPSSAPPPA